MSDRRPHDRCRPAPPPARLDPLVRRIFVGFAFSALGGGLTMPFLYVYLAEVRGIATATVGLLFAWMGVLGFARVAGGRHADRPLRPAPGDHARGCCMEAVGAAAIAHVRGTGSAFLVATFLAVGTLGLYPAARRRC